MKKLILSFIFLIGLMAYSCVAPPDVGMKQGPIKSELIKAVDQPASFKVVMVAQENLPVPDTPAPVKWVDENFWSFIATIAFSLYEFLALKIPTSKSVSIIGNLYKLLIFFIPDKSKNGGKFSINAPPPE